MTTALSFLFVLGVLVFVHELGHFLVARWHGVRVLTFSLGFGPKIVKFVRGGTEYCISVIPLGGYVKLAGETSVDETRSGAPDEFVSKSKWVRFQVYIAGPIMNILLAIIVLAGVLSQGADVPLYESTAVEIGRVEAGSPADGAGIRVGDVVRTVDGVSVPGWESFHMAVLPKAGREVVLGVERDGQRTDLRVTPAASGRYDFGDLGVFPVMRPQILGVNPGPAQRAGFEAGDVVVAVNGARDLDRDVIIEQIRAHANQTLSVTVERAGREIDLPVVPEGPEGAAVIGVTISPVEVRRVDPSLYDATRMSLDQTWASTLLVGRTLRGLFTRDTPVRQLMGPVAIAEMSGDAAERGWISIFSLMAMISLQLGLLNLMPVPVLDGGHIAILAVEGLARRDLSIAIKERILMAGAALIVLLMVTVIYNDIARLMR